MQLEQFLMLTKQKFLNSKQSCFQINFKLDQICTTLQNYKYKCCFVNKKRDKMNKNRINITQITALAHYYSR